MDKMIHPETESKNRVCSDTEFSKYPLSSDILEALSLLGYAKPTDIQKSVIPLVLEGKDIAAKSKTGTGKTAAFAIPIAEKIIWEENSPQALVLEPTRELSVQVGDEFFYIGRKKRLKAASVFGGFPIDKQIQTLKQKCHVAAGTPGRVMDHIRRGTIKLDKIAYLVIDEADLMLDMGFREDVRQIIAALPTKPQILLFSATLGDNVKSLAEDYMSDTVYIYQEDNTETEGNIEEIIYEVNSDGKYDAFVNVFIHENPDTCMIFCGTREMVNVLYRKLKRNKIDCGMIHGAMEQQERIKIIEGFRSGEFRYLIATDVAARGVDFENITHVINYDFPTGRETYVHRAGRTGRNGCNGRAISFVTEDDKKMKRMVEEFTGKELPASICPAPDPSSIKAFRDSQKKKRHTAARKGAVLNHSILRITIGGGKKSKMRAADIVGALCNIEGIDASDIGIIDVRDSLTYVEVLNGKGQIALDTLKDKPIKGKIRKVRATRAR